MNRCKRIYSILFSFIGLAFSFPSISQTNMSNSPIHYELSMSEPHTHYFEVKMTVNASTNKEFIDFKMAVWTPGSYLIREYAKNVEAFEAKSGSSALKFQKISKNTWRVFKNKSEKN